ncbi:MAG: hypothetical protein KatS3mg128_1203 [Silanimonas sp.]|nr:MAG: hypothetical protein KatS3mg127_0427 [Silanimonas sp.]GIX40154.1 MAG: hypothetical protein KatS3mg128_1203 [Silanimonas sp.]
MTRTSLAALLGLALATAPAVQAKGEGLSYTYVEGRLAHVQVDALGSSDLTVNGKGGGIAGSLAFGQTGLFATASHDIADSDAADFDLDMRRSSLGLGYALAIDERLHLVLDAKALRIKGKDGSDSVREDGWQASVGLRSMLSQDVEASIKAGLIDVDGRDWVFYDRNAIVELGARWHIDGMWSVGLDAAFTRDERNAMLGLRAQW